MRNPKTAKVALAVLLTAATLAIGLTEAVSSGAASTSQTFYACLNAGALAKVGTVAPTCGKAATLISWNSTGPAGAPGAAGAAGAPGPVGPAGSTGSTGPTGDSGPAGAAGPSNFLLAEENGYEGTLTQWLASLVGPVGAAGSQGEQGVTGDTGPAGPPGPTGAAGATGQQGPAGPTGATGSQGPAGSATPIFTTVGAGTSWSVQAGDLTLTLACNATNPQLQFTEANPGEGIMGWNYDTGATTQFVGSPDGPATDNIGLGSLPSGGQVITIGNASGPIAGTFNYYQGGNVVTFTISAFPYIGGKFCQMLGTYSVALAAS